MQGKRQKWCRSRSDDFRRGCFRQNSKNEFNSFTPTKAGTYYIIYESAYEENGKQISTKKEFNILILGGDTDSFLTSDGNGEEISSGCGSTLGDLVVGTGILVVGLLTFLRKGKKES